MSDDFNNRASDHFISTLKNFLTSLSYPKGKISSDDSLKTNLAEFQKYKRLSVADGSLNAETFRALGEELTPVQIEILVLHHPELKHLFIGRRRNGFLFRPTLQPETINLDLNIVYEKGNFTEAQARDFLKETIQDAKDVYGELKIEFNVFFTEGAGTERDSYSGEFSRIGTGAKEGIINVLLFFNHKTQKDQSKMVPRYRQIFIWKSNATKVNPLGGDALAHELGHLFGLTGFLTKAIEYIFGEDNRAVPIFSAIDNFSSDFIASNYYALGFLRTKQARYGIDWVDDYRTSTDQSSLFGQAKVGGAPRQPTTLDIYRVGAKLIAEQTKK